ncbi:unnamed protein product [Closterium sp. Naga37s-1]|nr:unnamed protein product [Closterium sp. Naga37s-1]
MFPLILPPPPAQSPAENPTARAPPAPSIESSCTRSPANRDNALPAVGARAGAARDFVAPSRAPAASPTFREFSYAELHAATGGFARVIGEGGVGTVYRGRMMLPAGDGAMREREVAVKEMKEHQFIAQELKTFKAEVAAMSALNHYNILKLEGVAFDAEQRPLLVYEYIPGGDITNLLQQGEQLPPSRSYSGLELVVVGRKTRFACPFFRSPHPHSPLPPAFLFSPPRPSSHMSLTPLADTAVFLNRT